VLQLPPYSFSPGVNGLINIPAFSQFPISSRRSNHLNFKYADWFPLCTVGNLVGAFTGGHLTDVYARQSARRDSERFSPESRLVLLIIPALIVPAGLLMFGFGSERKLHWVVLFVGYGCINVVNGAASIAMTYVMDSYFEVVVECLLMVNG
jgi:MFS family permease